MPYKIKFIKEAPTTDQLIALYESELYQELITEIGEKTNCKFTTGSDKQMIRQVTKRRFLILNIPMEEVLSEIAAFKSQLLNFSIERSIFYNDYEEEHPDGEFGEGDELEEGDESEIVEELGTSKSFLLDSFCEFYLLKHGDKERSLHFLKTLRMPYAKKHLSEISKIYKDSQK